MAWTPNEKACVEFVRLVAETDKDCQHPHDVLDDFIDSANGLVTPPDPRQAVIDAALVARQDDTGLPALYRAVDRLLGGLIERQCKHGCGHPDPDSLMHVDPLGDRCLDVHGCDGCCEVTGREVFPGESLVSFRAEVARLTAENTSLARDIMRAFEERNELRARLARAMVVVVEAKRFAAFPFAEAADESLYKSVAEFERGDDGAP